MSKLDAVATAHSVLVRSGGKSTYADLVGTIDGTATVKVWGTGELVKVPVAACTPAEMPDAKEFFAVCNRQRQRAFRGKPAQRGSSPVVQKKAPLPPLAHGGP